MVVGKGKGQVFRFIGFVRRARDGARDGSAIVMCDEREEKKKTRDATLVTGSSVALNAGRGPFKPLKVAARNRPRDASSDAGTRDAERNRAADGVSARASAPPRPEACVFPAVRAEWSVAAAS